MSCFHQVKRASPLAMWWEAVGWDFRTDEYMQRAVETDGVTRWIPGASTMWFRPVGLDVGERGEAR